MRLFNGDSIDVLKELEPCSVDAVVTDPPYGLGQCSPHQVSECLAAWSRGDVWRPKGSGFMGKAWDAWVPPPELWREVYRVLKHGGHVLAFAGSRTQDIMSISLRLAGFEVRDTIQWLYGSGFPKSHNIGKAIDKMLGNEREVVGFSKSGLARGSGLSVSMGIGNSRELVKVTAPSSEEAKQWEGWGTALKPAYEPAILCRKPLEGTVAENVLKHGVGGVNIDGCRIETDDDLGRVNDDDCGLFKVGKGMNEAAKRQRLGLAPLGRWPSNVILDEEIEGGEWKRFFYCAKASREERERGLDGFEKKKAGAMSGEETRPNKPSNHPIRANIHPTVKPIDLMKYLCRLITPPQGVILDPFMGSGSTGIGAGLEGFDFIGIEREKEYFEIAKARIDHWVKSPLTYDRPPKEVKQGEQISLF